MQTNRFKIYSYPYLAEYSSDFKNNQFHLEARAEYKDSDETIVFRAQYSINNDYINKLISQGCVRVVVKVACKPLGYSRVYEVPCNSTSICFEVNSLDLDGDVDLDAFLVTNEDIRLKDQSLSKGWDGEEPYVEKGNVIGESNTYVISADHYKDGWKKSIVSFTEVRSMEGKEYYEYDLSRNRIVFKLSPQMYKRYSRACNKNEESIIVCFLIPTFACILQKMKESDETSNFNSENSHKEWYKVISNKYEKEFHQDPCESSIEPSVAAQLLLRVGPKRQNAASKELEFIAKKREEGAKDD